MTAPTAFALLTGRCGLSQSAAAEVLKVSPSTVDKMTRGVRNTPAGIIDDLQRLYAMIEKAAEEMLATFAALPVPAESPIELGYAADDYEARQLGWPCVGAQLASIGIVMARSPLTFRLVPRGSTPGTAAAMAAHGQ